MKHAEIIEQLRLMIDTLEDDLRKHPDKPSRIEKTVSTIKDLLEYL